MPRNGRHFRETACRAVKARVLFAVLAGLAPWSFHCDLRPPPVDASTTDRAPSAKDNGAGDQKPSIRDGTGPSDLNCSFDARCTEYQGIGGNCFDEQDPNPCCSGPVHAVYIKACKKGTTRCLTFANDCLPSGWEMVYPDASHP